MHTLYLNEERDCYEIRFYAPSGQQIIVLAIFDRKTPYSKMLKVVSWLNGGELTPELVEKILPKIDEWARN